MLLSPEFIVGTTKGATLGRGVTLRVDDLVLLVVGFSWLARMAINKELGLFLKTPLNKPIAYYIITCLISTLLGVLFGRVQLKTGLLFVLKYFEYMIVYFMVVNNLSTKKQAQNYLWAMLITCMIVSIFGIYQIRAGGRVSAPFEGESGEPNTFGGYLVFMTSLAMGLFLTTSSFRNKVIFTFLICLFSVPFFYTLSRSAYLAAIPAVLSIFWLTERKYWSVPLILLFCIGLPFFAPQAAKDRVLYTFTQGKDRPDVVEIRGVRLDTSTSARLRGFGDASRDWIKHPFLGFGITGHFFVDAQYVRLLIETGILGFITFFLLVISILRQGYGVFKESVDPFYKGLSMGFLAGFIGLLFHAIGANTFIIVRIMEPFWFVTAMVMMIPELKEDEAAG